VLEKGTPGPPSSVGRSLANIPLKTNNASNPVHGVRHVVKKVMDFSGASTRIATVNTGNSDRSMRSSSRTKTVHSGDIFRTSRMHSRGRAPSLQNEKERAVIKIQSAFRARLARTEMERMKRVAKPGSGKTANKLSGAVALGWADVAGRFVRYLSEHFWEVGESSSINVLIIETLLAHLIKARTHFIDINENRLSESQIHKAHRLEFHKPQQLTKTEFNAYNSKKEVLNSLGVTSLLARILASLSDDVIVDGFPDRVIQLLVEMLDGGNKYVQQTLYLHLLNVDSDGKFLSHIEKRMHHAFDMYTAGKRTNKAKKSGLQLSSEVMEACDHLIQTFRLLQLLCEGHHLGFQDFLRHQSGHTSSQVNIIKTSCEFVIQLCESKETIERFSMVEISVLSQVHCACFLHFEQWFLLFLFLMYAKFPNFFTPWNVTSIH